MSSMKVALRQMYVEIGNRSRKSCGVCVNHAESNRISRNWTETKGRQRNSKLINKWRQSKTLSRAWCLQPSTKHPWWPENKQHDVEWQEMKARIWKSLAPWQRLGIGLWNHWELLRALGFGRRKNATYLSSVEELWHQLKVSRMGF